MKHWIHILGLITYRARVLSVGSGTEVSGINSFRVFRIHFPVALFFAHYRNRRFVGKFRIVPYPPRFVRDNSSPSNDIAHCPCCWQKSICHWMFYWRRFFTGQLFLSWRCHGYLVDAFVSEIKLPFDCHQSNVIFQLFCVKVLMHFNFFNFEIRIRPLGLSPIKCQVVNTSYYLEYNLQSNISSVLSRTTKSCRGSSSKQWAADRNWRRLMIVPAQLWDKLPPLRNDKKLDHSGNIHFRAINLLLL